MKKILLISSMASIFTFLSFGVNAEGDNTLSIGYAQSHVKVSVGGVNVDLNDSAKGFNIKARHEFDDNWGMIGSFAYTHKGYDLIDYSTVDIDYYSLSVGPTYRFNEYMSVYGLVGVAHGKAELKTIDYRESGSESKLVGGVGLQFNPVENIVIDASYEYTRFGDFKVGTWMLGAGFRF
ncbi:Ail/Lom family outer membrane beta-barrel protein [Arsenophonus nasoniae]|uniref:Ail/Lom family outer membrane beta-barrel protein n=1 Tax=Arsenophonus nasoniae TaxID=638 RepID=A0AA95GB23_9GAMM|nr:Ail/Lom family outer membrane beta-barrel protein [Arsenophonus nasoniae]WGL93748.1 Ail/Lom family outer membrane beta-barrel protein [Arsenophonus nasoniae]WGL96040.1 Ail/Lom family outer membrane beta-barrel protein [Arsenophonus nasoniae]